MVAPGCRRQVLIENRRGATGPLPDPEQSQDRGADEEQEGDHRRDGVPGRPKTSAPPGAAPNQVGLPGFSATLQKIWSTPSEASAALT